MKPLLTLCMIVKNEEKVLERCLISVQNLVDEIIIIDTGSDDRTKEIACKYTNQVYDFEWNQDFSAARNESLRRAKGRWILVLDADEYVQSKGHEQLRQYLKGYSNPEPCGFILKIINFTGSGHDETKMMESTGARLFRNDSSISYTQPLHEQLTSSRGEVQLASLSFTIFHTGYTEDIVQNKNKAQRNMAILEKMKFNNHNEAYYYFILGNEYSNSDQKEQALHSYQQSYEISSPKDSWYHHLADRLITTEMQQGLYHLAAQHIQTGIQLMPHHTDYYCFNGILLDSLGFWNAAARKFETCLRIAEEAELRKVPYWIVQPTYGKIIPYQMLGEIHRKKGDLENAIPYWIKMIHLQPKNYAVLQQLTEHLLVVNSTEQVERILETLYPQTVPMNSVLLFKIALQTGNKQLISCYRKTVNKLGIQIGYGDTVLSDLLDHKSSILIDRKQEKETITSPIAIMAKIIFNNMNLDIGVVSDPDICLRLSQQALAAIHDQPFDPFVLENHEHLFAQTLLLMWKFDYKEIYFTLLQRMANAQTISLLAGKFYQMGRMDEALELFSLLLDNDVLGAEGLKTIGQWYINMGELSEGYKFIKASIASEPTIDLLGRIQEYFHTEDCVDLLTRYYSRYPHLHGYTFS